MAITMLAGAAALAQAQDPVPNHAERLGWPPGSRVVIFHVDDVGMSHDSNLGAQRAMDPGLATSFSIMMPCPWVPEILAWLRERPAADAGLHLTLTSEWKRYRWGPVAGASAVPGLVDRQGCLRSSGEDVSAHATRAEVEAEIRAQIDKARRAGLQPTHLDSHMGVCFLPSFVEDYVRLGIEYRIPILIFGGHLQHLGPYVGERAKELRLLAEKVWQAGLPVIDDLVTNPTPGKTYSERKQHFLELLDGLQPGISQIILHCTDAGERFSAISGSAGKRRDEMNLMLDPEVKEKVRTAGIHLTTWRELARRRKAR